MVAFLFFLALGLASYAVKSMAGVISFINPEVTPDTNIHFNKKFCAECHLQVPDGRKLFLRFKDFTMTCRCHGYTSKNYTHPLGNRLSPENRRKIPPEFPLAEGKITCNTCHDLALQCNPESRDHIKNGIFLRVNPRLLRTGLCYQCHSITRYRKLSPHKQLDRAGNIIETKCLFCHKMKPDEKNATLKKQRSGETGTVEFVEEFNILCFRCHYRQTRMHITNTNHLKPPPAKILANIKSSEKELKVIFPLDNNQAIACPTCHNPHQEGVIPPGRPGAKGAGKEKRLRVTRLGNRICAVCHNH